MSEEKLTPTQIMDSTYKRKAPKFPEVLSRCDSNNILAYMTQRLPMKVRTEACAHKNVLFFVQGSDVILRASEYQYLCMD